jgi:predicted phage terminase large subunit-like protein
MLLSAEDIAALSPEAAEEYVRDLKRVAAVRSPLDLAELLEPTTIRYPHSELINDAVVALVEYRLYRDGPGPEGVWLYRTEQDGELHRAASAPDIPPNAVEFFAVHPDDVEAPEKVGARRVIFQLAIALPPRHGKSFIVSQWTPLWYWLRYPDHDIALATYSDDFASSQWGTWLRRAVHEHRDFLGYALEGGARASSSHFKLSGDPRPAAKLSERDEFHEVRRTGGGVRLVGREGAITGTGFQFGIIDDPFKSFADASSQANREAAARWYTSTWRSRKTRIPGRRYPVEVMMFTRWHTDDLTGRFVLTENGTVRPDWYLLHLPAICDDPTNDPLHRPEGAALCPAIKTRAELLQEQAHDPVVFAALQQGRPTAGGTGAFNRMMLYENSDKIYVTLDDLGDSWFSVNPEECVRFATMDVAATKNTWSDWTVFSAWDFHIPTQNLFLVWRERQRITTDVQADWVLDLCRAWNVRHVGVEHKTFGINLAHAVNARNAGVMMELMKMKGDHFTRAAPYIEMCKARKVFFPKQAPWISLWLEEHAGFPHATRHDDQVDTGSFAVEYVRRYPSKAATPDAAPAEVPRHERRFQTGGRRRAIWQGRLGSI